MAASGVPPRGQPSWRPFRTLGCSTEGGGGGRSGGDTFAGQASEELVFDTGSYRSVKSLQKQRCQPLSSWGGDMCPDLQGRYHCVGESEHIFLPVDVTPRKEEFRMV